MIGGSSLHNNSAPSAINVNGQGVMWEVKTNGGFTSTNAPVIGPDGTIYVGCSSDSLYRPGQLYAIDPQGKIEWTHSVEMSCAYSPAVDQERIVYVASCAQGNAYLDALYPNGTLKWRFDGNTTREGTEFINIGSSPVIARDGSLRLNLLNTQDSSPHFRSLVCSVDANGTLLWKYRLEEYMGSNPAVGNDLTTYVRSESGNLSAIDRDGNLKWNLGLGGEHGNFASSSPAIGPDGTIYVGDSATYYGPLSFHAVDPNGTIRWAYEVVNDSRSGGFGTNLGPAVSADGTIYFFANPGVIYTSMLDFTTEKVPGRLYCLSSNGTLKWVADAGDIYGAYPLVDNGSRIIVSGSGKVMLFSSDGSMLRSYQSTTSVSYFNPVLAADGTLLLLKMDSSSRSGSLVASDGLPKDTLTDLINKNWVFLAVIIIASAMIIGVIASRRAKRRRRDRFE
jgi:outer membrane protein assembly factor BamB